MPAVFEIHLMYKSYIAFSKITDILKNNDIFFQIENIESMDNWEFDNYKILCHQSDIDILIQNQNKIILIEGMINSRYRSGIIFSRGEENRHCLDFWVTTKGLEQLDSNNITDYNAGLYQKLKIQLTAYLDKKSLLLCGIGSEVLITESSRTEDIVDSSKNVCMWILPNKMFDAKLNNYKIETINNFFVYSLKE